MHTFLTVKETIGFSAMMRLPTAMSIKDKEERVKETILQVIHTESFLELVG